ncbi:MAG: D-alanine--D-alanine ligase [Alphaproteobacteria bacterium]|nr:D-alanine--D-alanine ligase [Alphaproteobacteria bacterium]TAD88401.1 MAG: D-alanine--D-alanine ligase [Alphaproteobacteria bacterium]
MDKPQHVVVLAGGWSAERQISLVTGAAVAAALAKPGRVVTTLDPAPAVSLPARLAALAPDVVFNALHGRGGEDGTVQGLLDLLGIPYTHSGVRASAAALHKPTARRLFQAAGLPVPQGVEVPWASLADADPLPRPYVAKPPDEGSTVGVRIVRPGDNLPPPDDPAAVALVEAFIPGVELTVAVLDDEPLEVIEIDFAGAIFDFEAKYKPTGGAVHHLPARIPDAVAQAARRIAQAAHQVLGCRGVSRADFRWDPAHGLAGLFLLEVNTQPGMTETSLVPEACAHRGIGFAELCERLIASARWGS